MRPRTNAAAVAVPRVEERRKEPKPRWLSPSQVMLVVAAVDAADGALLSSSFPAFESSFGLSPRQLGTLMMLQSAAGSTTLPVWGWLLRSTGYKRLLVWAVGAWGTSTLLSAWASTFGSQAVLRIVTGAALSCVMPLAQSLLAEATPEKERGGAFGLFSSIERASGMTVGFFVVASGPRWRECYYLVAAATLILLGLVHLCLPSRFGQSELPASKRRSFASSLRTILSLPTFAVMVAQGVLGATPWRAMAFLNLLWLGAGFTRDQAATIGACTQIGGILGAVVGGKFGDMASVKMPASGRIMVAQLSTLACIPLWVAWLRVDTSVALSIGVGFCFYFLAVWASVAACRPICAELVADPVDRANIVAMWVFLEGAASAVFGGPIVGYLSEFYGYKIGHESSGNENAHALRRALVNIGALMYFLCSICWGFMYLTFPKDRMKSPTPAKRRDVETPTDEDHPGNKEDNYHNTSHLLDENKRLLRPSLT